MVAVFAVEGTYNGYVACLEGFQRYVWVGVEIQVLYTSRNIPGASR
jgi:hypothetical protein